MYQYDKDFIKQNLSLEQIEALINELGGEPERHGEIIVSKTICHGGDSHKLYYYPNTTLFKCYTDCSDTFDVFELIRRVFSREKPKPRKDSEWTLPEAIDFIARKFGYAPNQQIFENTLEIEEDLKLLEKYDRIKDIDVNTQEVELKEYNATFLEHLPHPLIRPWLEEGISKEVMDAANICYDPKNQGIVIPHYDINNRLVGIRERTLITEQAENYGKYMPARIGRQMYNHPLSFNLYNLNHSKNNIQRMEKAFVFEGEKSTLKYRSYFGENNDLSVSICGSSIINYQVWLLIQQGAKEIIICLDKQFQETGDDEFKKLVKNLKGIHNKYGKYVTISYMFDKNNLLDYKDSPIDKSKEVFLELYKRRVNLY
jgi:hypothetical protein